MPHRAQTIWGKVGVPCICLGSADSHTDVKSVSVTGTCEGALFHYLVESADTNEHPLVPETILDAGDAA